MNILANIDVFRTQTLIGAFICILAIVFFMCRGERGSLLWVITWGYLLLSATYLAFPVLFDSHYARVLKWNISSSGAQCLIQLLILPLAVSVPTTRNIRWLMDFTKFFLFVWASYFLFGGEGSLFGNTVDAAVIAIFLPTWFWDKRSTWNNWTGFLVCLTAVLYVRGASGVLIVGAQAAALLVSGLFNGIRPRLTIALLLGLANIGFIGYVLQGDKLWDNNGRLMIWAHHFEWWWDNANHWFGTGLGAYEWISAFMPSGQFHSSGEEIRYMLMHNDWLQILWETGYVGLALFSFAAGHLLWITRKRPELLTAACGIGACMTVYFPLHIFLVQILGLIVFRFAYNDEYYPL